MCSGFWFGIFVSFLLESPTGVHFTDGCIASLLSEIVVTGWIAIAKIGNAAGEVEAACVEAKNALNLWRYYKSVPAEKPQDASDSA